MTTRTSTSRAIEVPNLVGDKADQAIQALRDLGLMPIMWSAAVDHVNEAGFVLGLDPPAGSPVRPKAPITISVATHPHFQGHADETLAAEPDRLVQPPLTWPLSSLTGCAPASSPQDPADPFATAAAPGAPSAPASPPLDAANREIRHDDAASSSAEEPTPDAAADAYSYDVSSPVPTADEISAAAEWDRLLAAEAARHATGPELEAPPVDPGPAVDADATAALDTAQALEEKARREARRRSARRHRRLTLKQKPIVVGVLALTLLIGLGAMSAHKPVAPGARAAHTAPRHAARAAHKTRADAARHDERARAARAAVDHKRATVRKHRAVTARNHARSHAARAHASAPTTSHTSPSPPVAPVSSTFSDTAPTSSGAGAPASATAPASTASTTPSHKSASTPSSVDSHSSGSVGGSTLQSPDGTTAPPTP